MSKISVILPVYNGAKYIAEAINGILQQDHGDFELVVVDDGSTDDTAEVVSAIKHPRLKFFRPGRLGYAKALNFAAANSTGEYIAVQDSDDISMPDRLSRQAEFLNAHPEVALVSASRRVVIDEYGSEVGLRDTGVRTHEQIVEKLLHSTNPLFHSACMYRREAYERLGGYDENQHCLLDYEFYIRMSAVAKLAAMDEILVHKRKHAQQFFWSTGGTSQVADYKKLISIARINFKKYQHMKASPVFLYRACIQYLKSVFVRLRLLR